MFNYLFCKAKLFMKPLFPTRKKRCGCFNSICSKNTGTCISSYFGIVSLLCFVNKKKAADSQGLTDSTYAGGVLLMT